MTTCKCCLHAGWKRLYCQWELQDSWHSQMSRCGPFQYRVCRSAAQPADVKSCWVRLFQSFRDSGIVRYNPASGEVLGCTVLKLASFYLLVPRTTVCHQRTVRGQSRKNWLRWLDMYKVNNIGPRTEPWGTSYSQSVLGDFPVQHARTVSCRQRMTKSSSALVQIYQRNSGDGRARCWCQ